MRLAQHWRRGAWAIGSFVATSGLVAACSSGGGDGSDEDYVRAVCESGEVLDEALGAMISAALSSDENEAGEVMANALEPWLNAIDAANPPSDAADAHNELVDVLREYIDGLRSGEISIEDDFGPLDNAPDPPQAAQDRLAAVAADTPACDGREFFS